MVTTEISGNTAIITILTDKEMGEDIEVSFEEGAPLLFVRQQTDVDVNVIALTPLQAYFLRNTLNTILTGDTD